MNHPLFHTRTETQLQLYLKNPSHGLLLLGKEGSGKTYTVRWLAQQLNSELRIVEALEKQSGISIEQVRGLYTQTRTGRSQTILLKNAHTMSKEAQNAFLKLLEEPPQSTNFILTASNSESLLQTIRSRVVEIAIVAPTAAQFQSYFHDTSSEFTQLLHITNRAVSSVATSQDSADKKEAVQIQMTEAKQFYQADRYSRHRHLISISYEKKEAALLLDNLVTIVRALMKGRSGNTDSLRVLSKQARLLETIKTTLQKQAGNPKIHLTKLAEML